MFLGNIVVHIQAKYKKDRMKTQGSTLRVVRSSNPT